MTPDERAEKALDRLVDEARRERDPDLDWQAVEGRLFERIAESRAPGPVRRAPSRMPWVLAAAAVTLAGVLASLGVLRHGVASPPIATEVATRPVSPLEGEARGPVNGDSLARGAVVTAANDAVVVEHRGHATWTLEAKSQAHVESLGDVVTVALDQGTLSARVVKSPRPESFVVLVDHTRIAVHGTAFRVERHESTVTIQLTEGVIAVGPVGAKGFEMFAPSTATVTLAGVRAGGASREATGPAGAPVAQATPPEPAATAEAPPAPHGAPVLPKETRHAAPPRQGRSALPKGTDGSLQRVVESVQRCFGEFTPSRGDLKVSVLTSMTLRVAPNGRVGDAVFTPPLAPSVRSCVDAAVGPLSFPVSDEGFSVARTLELEH